VPSTGRSQSPNSGGLQDRRTGQAYFNRAMLATGNREEAIALYERAADILTVAVGAQHSSVRAAFFNIGQHYQGMAEALVKLGQDAAAVPLLEKSVAAWTVNDHRHRSPMRCACSRQPSRAVVIMSGPSRSR
jgi:hypothetical protein